jgi:hypothetical protein
MQLKEFVKSYQDGWIQHLFLKQAAIIINMLKNITARSIISSQKYCFTEDPTDTMDDGAVNAPIDLYNRKRAQLDNYRLVKKSVQKTKCTRNITMEGTNYIRSKNNLC